MGGGEGTSGVNISWKFCFPKSQRSVSEFQVPQPLMFNSRSSRRPVKPERPVGTHVLKLQCEGLDAVSNTPSMTPPRRLRFSFLGVRGGGGGLI